MSSKDLVVPDNLQKPLESIEYGSLEDAVQLMKDTNMTKTQVSPEGSPSRNMLQEGLFRRHDRITTSSKRLDHLLGPVNGISTGNLVEFSGAPGCGKTQLCMTLALNVQLPVEKGGLDGQCIYIDTEGGLMAERFYQMAGKNNNSEQIQQALGNITYFRVLDHMEMIALVRQLPDVLQDSPNVKLLIVDSIAYHLRLNIRQNRVRVGLVNFIGESLSRMASRFHVAVVVTSHVSTDMKFGGFRPALGDTWTQWCTKRLMLTRRRHQRYASIYESSRRTPYTMEPFAITKNGIEDADEDTLARMSQWQELDTQKNDISPPKIHQPKGFSKWTDIYDSEDIWNEPGGFTDELLSEIPLDYLSTDISMDKNEEQCATKPDRQLTENHDDSISLCTSNIPPTSYLSQTLRRKQPSQDSVVSSNNSKKARHDEATSTALPPMVDIKDEDQCDGSWSPDSDEIWLGVAEVSSPFV